MSDLDLKEQGNVRAALCYLQRRAGTWAGVAEALRFKSDTVKKVAYGRDLVSASMALRVARLIDVPIDDLLGGRYQPDACPKCGYVPSYLPARVSDFSDENTVVEDAPRQPVGLTLVK